MRIGYKHSEETKRKISLAHKGKKMSSAHRKKSSKGFFKTGQTPWNKGNHRQLNDGLDKWRKSGKGKDDTASQWKGDKVGYHGIHKWLKRIYGKAKHCENVNCPQTHNYFEWALLKGNKYERKRENFVQLCLWCHRQYDGNIPDWRLRLIKKKGKYAK